MSALGWSSELLDAVAGSWLVLELDPSRPRGGWLRAHLRALQPSRHGVDAYLRVELGKGGQPELVATDLGECWVEATCALAEDLLGRVALVSRRGSEAAECWGGRVTGASVAVEVRGPARPDQAAALLLCYVQACAATYAAYCLALRERQGDAGAPGAHS